MDKEQLIPKLPSSTFEKLYSLKAKQELINEGAITWLPLNGGLIKMQFDVTNIPFKNIDDAVNILTSMFHNLLVDGFINKIC
ncbi:hypothetical protein AB8U03_15705 [Clostridium sp. Mt-5]|uniref:Uncharacterized protein n=1 Tax=Clostridium moutaii TaxID=3240932 RepID=A0ABV4BSZ1_9CLOT